LKISLEIYLLKIGHIDLYHLAYVFKPLLTDSSSYQD
jgi:hypothetical protein